MSSYLANWIVNYVKTIFSKHEVKVMKLFSSKRILTWIFFSQSAFQPYLFTFLTLSRAH